ncbi:Gamma-L-glutamyl-butirosin B gamma-glutamyl cyclotransferase [compost metagenome]
MTAEVLQRPDELEEYYGPGDARNDYERVVTEVTTDTGVAEAWVYVYSHSQQYAAGSGRGLEALPPDGQRGAALFCLWELHGFVAYSAGPAGKMISTA